MVKNMKEYLGSYIKETEEKLKGKITKSDIENHLNKINFFSHERLIHLIVTMFFALFAILFFLIYLNLNTELLLVIDLILIVVLVFYIFHYFYLENNVQYLYKLYDKMIDKLK